MGGLRTWRHRYATVEPGFPQTGGYGVQSLENSNCEQMVAANNSLGTVLARSRRYIGSRTGNVLFLA